MAVVQARRAVQGYEASQQTKHDDTTYQHKDDERCGALADGIGTSWCRLVSHNPQYNAVAANVDDNNLMLLFSALLCLVAGWAGCTTAQAGYLFLSLIVPHCASSQGFMRGN
ncbi:MAG: hypothetical protein HC876_16360 [Chloroflexaceae bacterium]|nr:hypothetical protein [Chloroflexaceae bacterium]